MEPETSVIIPTYNRCTMVREAVASVMAQRCDAPFELIVIDDGSTDGTTEELRRLAVDAYAQPGGTPVRIERTRHRGPAAARNRGIALARARLIAFLDSDDLWAPQKLERQLAFMRDHPECVLSQTEELWVRNGRRVNPGKRHKKRAGEIFIDSLRTCLVSPSAAILRTDLLRAAGGFDEQMAAAEDYDLWLRILAEHEAGLLEEPLVTRRAGHPGQLSAIVPALDRFRILALAKLIARTGLAPARCAAAAEVLAEKCAIYASGLARRGRIDQANFYETMRTKALDAWRIGPDGSLSEAIACMREMLASGSRSERPDAQVAEDRQSA
jgi:glycosyltransferase involved in cell wall biosynthesis